MVGQGKAACGSQQRGDVPMPVDRHDLVTHLIRGGVERDGQIRRRPKLGQLIDPGYDPGGGNGQASGRQAGTPRMLEDFERAHHLIQVAQRLAHAHEDHVARLLSRQFHAPVELLDHLAGG